MLGERRTSCHIFYPQNATLRIVHGLIPIPEDFSLEITSCCYIMSEVREQLRGLSADIAALLDDQFEALRSLNLDDRFSEVALATEFWDRGSELDVIEGMAFNIKTKRRLEEMFMKLAKQGTDETERLCRIMTTPTVNNLAA
jgi:hypothetical protein